MKNLTEKEKELIKINEKLNENKMKLQNDYVNLLNFFSFTLKQMKF